MTTRTTKGDALQRDVEQRADALLKARIEQTKLGGLREAMEEACRAYLINDSWVARLAWVRARRAWKEAGGTDER